MVVEKRERAKETPKERLRRQITYIKLHICTNYVYLTTGIPRQSHLFIYLFIFEAAQSGSLSKSQIR